MKRIAGVTGILMVLLVGYLTGGELYDTEVIIVGGGIAGLTSAYCLDQEGYDFIVLEKEDVVGGKAIGGQKNGFFYAKGAEYIGEPEDLLKEMIDELNVDLVEIPSPMDIHYANGRKYYGDDGLALLLVEESSVEEYNQFVKAVLEIYEEYDEIPYFDEDSDIAELDDMTAAEWFEENDFSDVYYDVYNVTSKGLFGATLEEVSALCLIPEIAFDFSSDDLLDEDDIAELKRLNKPFKKLKGSEAYTFKTGMAELPLALYDELEEHIKLSSYVQNIEEEDDIYQVTYKDTKTGQIKTLTAENVIIAVPAPIVPWIAKDVLTREQLNMLNQIPYANYITAALYTNQYIVNDAFDTAVPGGWFFTDIYDSTWVQRSYDSSVRNRKNSIISLYIAPPGYKSDALEGMSEATVLKKIYDDLGKINDYKNIKNHVTGYDVYYIKYAYPIMTPGAYGRLLDLHESLDGSVQLAGDYMIYPTFEAAVEAGEIAAEKIMDLYD